MKFGKYKITVEPEKKDKKNEDFFQNIRGLVNILEFDKIYPET